VAEHTMDAAATLNFVVVAFAATSAIWHGLRFVSCLQIPL